MTGSTAMYNGNSGNGYGAGFPALPHVAVDVAPEEQNSDRDDNWTGGLASQDVNAQHYSPNNQTQDDEGLTYGEGRTYGHSDSFADHAPHTLVCSAATSAHNLGSVLYQLSCCMHICLVCNSHKGQPLFVRDWQCCWAWHSTSKQHLTCLTAIQLLCSQLLLCITVWFAYS